MTRQTINEEVAALAERRLSDGVSLPAEVQPQAMIERAARLLLDRHLGAAGEPSILPGGRRDAFDKPGRCIAKRMPASAFYHLFLAFAEMLRRSTPARAPSAL